MLTIVYAGIKTALAIYSIAKAIERQKNITDAIWKRDKLCYNVFDQIVMTKLINR